jgi:hypothetical protein
LTDTPLAGLRHKAKWVDYAKQLVEGTSIRRSAATVGIHSNTAFRWRHRFLKLLNGQQAISLAGIAEADETYFLESQKGRRQGLSRAPRKRGAKASKRGLSAEQTAVLICRDRTGNTADVILGTDGEKALAAVATVMNQGKTRWMIVDEALNADKLIEFLTALIKDADRKAFLILDNLRVHRSKIVKAWVEERKDKIELFYLPSYDQRKSLWDSPELNPEERLNAGL